MAKYQIESRKTGVKFEVEYFDDYLILVKLNDEWVGHMDIEQHQAIFANTPLKEEWFFARWMNNPQLIITKIGEDLRFETFWNRYGYKVGGKIRATMLWQKLTDLEKSAALDAIPKYDKWLKFKQIVEKVYPETYLSQRRWENSFSIK